MALQEQKVCSCFQQYTCLNICIHFKDNKDNTKPTFGKANLPYFWNTKPKDIYQHPKVKNYTFKIKQGRVITWKQIKILISINTIISFSHCKDEYSSTFVIIQSNTALSLSITLSRHI